MTCRSQFSPLTLWVLGLELGSSFSLGGKSLYLLGHLAYAIHVRDFNKVGCHRTLSLIHKQALIPAVLEDLALRMVLWEAVSQC